MSWNGKIVPTVGDEMLFYSLKVKVEPNPPKHQEVMKGIYKTVFPCALAMNFLLYSAKVYD